MGERLSSTAALERIQGLLYANGRTAEWHVNTTYEVEQVLVDAGYGCPPPRPIFGDAATLVAEQARARFATGERGTLAVTITGENWVTLDLGKTLGADTRAGAILARLLAADAGASWWVIGYQPTRPLKRQGEAAERIVAAGRLVGMEITGVLLLVGGRVHLLNSLT